MSVERRELFTERMPSTLDIIKIDKRWAQIVACGDKGEEYTLIFLGDRKNITRVDLKKYNLVKKFDQSVKGLVEQGENFTPTELKNIHWGEEQAKSPHLKLEVTVFGEYEKKILN